MMNRKSLPYLFSVLAAWLFSCSVQAQNPFNEFNLQLKVYDSLEHAVSPPPSFPFTVRVSFSDSASTLLYREDHTIAAWNKGLVNLRVGTGTVSGSGAYAQLRSIPFENKVSIKVESNVFGTMQTLMDKPLLTLPFAGLSLRNIRPPAIAELLDVESASLPMAGYVLKWNGSKWEPQPDLSSDTAAYSYEAHHVEQADTATYAYTAQPLAHADSAIYAHQAGTSAYATTVDHAVHTTNAGYVSLTNMADSILYGWSLFGNHSLTTYRLGTTDLKSLVIKTNNGKRLTIKADSGWVGINADTAHAALHLHGNNGFLYNASGTAAPFGVTALSGTPSLFFSTDSSAFRGGLVTGTQWDNANRHRHTFAFGRNSVSNGFAASVVFGDSCSSHAIPPPPLYTSDYTDGYAAIAFGKNCQASGRVSFVAGYGSKANFFRGVAMGYECVSYANAAQHAIGYRAICKGANTLALGSYVKATGHKSSALGSYASTDGRNGCFIYGDNSTTDTVKNTAINQFMVRAAGGTVFYTDMNATAGVQLMAGSGSWNTLSDSSMKKEVFAIQPLEVMEKFNQVKIKSWSYKTQPGIAHLGPMSQDLFAAYHLGAGETGIDMVDADGLTMALIQALRQNQLEQQEELKKIKAASSEMIEELEYGSLENQIEEIIKKLNK